MVKFQTIKQKARFLLNSDDAKKTIDNVAKIVITEPPIVFDGGIGIIVDVLTNNIHINGHSLTPAERVVYTTQGTAIGGLTHNTVYYVIHKSDDIIQLSTTPENSASETPITLTSVGAGNQTLTTTSTFLPSQITNAYSLRIANHTFETGTPVLYNSTGLTVDLLTNNQVYYAINNTPNTVRLAETAEDAENNVFIPIPRRPDTVGETHTLSKAVIFNVQATPVIDTVREQLNIPAHNYKTGDKVQYRADTAAVAGLIDNQYYYVIYVDVDSIKLAYSYEDAIRVPPRFVNITGVGTGNNHSLLRVESVLNICTNYKFKLDNLPSNLNDKCRMAVVYFDYVKNNNSLNPKSVGGVYIKSISPIDTFSSQGYYKGNLLLPAYFDNTLSYQNFDIEQNSIPLPHNIAQILQNGIDIFVDSKKKDHYGQDISGSINDDAFNLCLVIYELEDFEYVSNKLNDDVQNYIQPKNYL